LRDCVAIDKQLTVKLLAQASVNQKRRAERKDG
jgi:hypothetical protein